MFGDDDRSVRPFQLVLIRGTQRQKKKSVRKTIWDLEFSEHSL